MISIYIYESYYAEVNKSLGGWKTMPCWPKHFYFNKPSKIYTDIDQYLQSDAAIKIAFNVVDHRSPSLTDINQINNVTQREKNRVKLLCEKSNLVFAIETEVHSPAMVEDPMFEPFDNLYWIMAGTVDRYSNQIIPWQYHIWRVAELYKELPGALDQLAPYAPKPKYFDAMLGTWKPHRAFVADQIKKNGYVNKIVHALGPMPGDNLTTPMNQGSDFIWEPDFEPLPGMDYLRLNQHIRYRGMIVQMPCVVPTQLFNTTAYSIICETGFANGTHMLSEKTAKVLLSRRMFVMFSGAGILKFIRNEGFKTFDCIIDESYDDIEDDNERWNAAFEQVKKLCSMNQQQVLDKVAPICEHNLKHAMSDLEFVPKSTVYWKIQTLINNLTQQ